MNTINFCVQSHECELIRQSALAAFEQNNVVVKEVFHVSSVGPQRMCGFYTTPDGSAWELNYIDSNPPINCRLRRISMPADQRGGLSLWGRIDPSQGKLINLQNLYRATHGMGLPKRDHTDMGRKWQVAGDDWQWIFMTKGAATRMLQLVDYFLNEKGWARGEAQFIEIQGYQSHRCEAVETIYFDVDKNDGKEPHRYHMRMARPHLEIDFHQSEAFNSRYPY